MNSDRNRKNNGTNEYKGNTVMADNQSLKFFKDSIARKTFYKSELK